MKLRRYAVYAALILLFFVMVSGFYMGTLQDVTDTTSRLIAIGRWLGIVTAFSILVELLLMSRIPVIENNFDVDEIQLFHRYNGYIVVYALIAHIVFLTLGYSQQTATGFVSQFIAFTTDFEDVLLAVIGSILFFVIAIASIKIVRHSVKYELWYVLHLGTYFAVALTFLHQVNSGSDFVSQDWYAYVWTLLFIGVFMVLLYYRFVRQIYYMYRHNFTVVAVNKEAENIYSLYISGKNIREFIYTSGQYATWRFLAHGYWYESHPFSFSSSYGDSHIRLSFKSASGDFSEKLRHIPIGTKVLIDGPRGAFSPERIATPDIVLIAGGIGIAPLLSMLRNIVHSYESITILYSVTHRNELAFSTEFNRLLQTNANIKLVPYESSTQGRINEDTLSSIIADVTTTGALICGPYAMTNAMSNYLIGLGVSKQNIVTEQFAF